MQTNTDFFLIKDQNGGFHKLKHEDVLYVKSLGNYLQFYASNKCLTTLGSLQLLEAKLSSDERFIRIHRSYLVNMQHVEHFSADGLTICDQTIPVSNKAFDSLKMTYIASHLIKL